MPGIPRNLIRRTAARASTYMKDEAVIQRYSALETTDDYGTPDKSYIDGPAIRCSINDLRTEELVNTAQVKVVDAIVRFPVDTILEIIDRVKLVTRLGRPLEVPIIYEIDGEVMRGDFGVICPLKIYTGVDNV